MCRVMRCKLLYTLLSAGNEILMSFTLIKRSNPLMDCFLYHHYGDCTYNRKKHSMFSLFILQGLWEHSGSLYMYMYNLVNFTISFQSVNSTKYFCVFLLLPALNETCELFIAKTSPSV